MFIRTSLFIGLSILSFALPIILINPTTLDASTLHAIGAIQLSEPSLVTFQEIDPPAEMATVAASIQNVLAKVVTQPAVSTAQSIAAQKNAAVTQSDTRSHLVIPSIGLNSPIDNVGVDASGAMAVPNGTTNDVGWYDAGTEPGQIGSAVMDAHVFAAFSKLHDVAVGDSIYVENASGQTLRFIVQSVETYALADVPAQTLFAQTDAARLNLITCAGKLTADHSTYDHRLIVYAVLAPDA